MPSAPRVLDFADHRRELGENRYVYAVVSRRARGLSIGINLNPGRDCTFACRYCQVHRTGADRSEPIDLARLEAELDGMLALVACGVLWERPPFDTVLPDLRRVADIAVAGDGEPTSCPRFAAAVQVIGLARARRGLDALPVRLLSNGSGLGDPIGRRGLARFFALGGDLWFKLDAGTAEAYRTINRGTLPYERLLANLLDAARQRPIVIQSLFARRAGASPTDGEIDSWIARLGEVVAGGGRLREVQVTTIARAPADPGWTALGGRHLERIADRARAAGLAAVAHPGRWGRRPVLVTAGATRNPLDSMRCVTANSSGTTGVELAAALQADHEVRLLASPEAALRASTHRVEQIEVFSDTRDLMARMEAWVRTHPRGAVIHAAAVGDYEARAEVGKIESGRPSWSPTLTPTPKILDRIRGWGEPGLVLVSFKAAAPGTDDTKVADIAQRQLARSGSDLVFANVLGRLDRGIALVAADGIRWFDARDEAVRALIDHPLLDG